MSGENSLSNAAAQYGPAQDGRTRPNTAALLRLRVTAEADLGALSRVLERFQNLNVVPRRVVAEMGSGDVLYIQVDIVGLAEERLSLIAAKLNQALSIRDAHWHVV
jgi:hypothetical protein